MLCTALIRVLADQSPVRRPIRLLTYGPFLCVLLFLVEVARAQSLVVTPSSLNFTQVADLADPPAQSVQVTASDGSHIPFTVPPPELSSGQNVWISFQRQPN